MKAIIILVVSACVLTVLGLFVYAHIWFRCLKKAARICAERRGENLCIRTDGVFPTVGEMPPEESMWRVRTDMFSFDGKLVFTFRYDPEKLDAADLDDPKVVESEIRAMERHGKRILEQQAEA